MYFILGWEGSGLGAQRQGIEEPIKGGEVRDKLDKYKVRKEELSNSVWVYDLMIFFQGVGMDMKDPFELFRKNMSYTFNRRERPPR